MMEDVGTSANQLVQLDSNAKVPAVDGSLLTGMSTTLSGASDPTLSTNPSGVGIKYKNTTDGEMFICTDATAGENVWTNVGAGTGNIAPYYYGGSSYSYVAGGNPSYLDSIDKFSFASDGNGVALGSKLAGGFGSGADQGAQSSTAGYYAGGTKGPSGEPYSNDIEKFIFATEATATNIGDLTVGRSMPSGTNSDTRGYAAGGTTAGPVMNTIDSWLFASDGNATDWGDLTVTRRACGSATYGTSYGFTIGGEGPVTAQIDRYAFSSTSNSTDFGDLTSTRNYCHGASSDTHGYSASGGSGTSTTNIIERFPFASGGLAVDVGDLVQTLSGNGASSSSTTHGYCMKVTTVEKYSFAAATTNATDVGDLSATRNGCKGTHV
jgi:hypothetical protein